MVYHPSHQLQLTLINVSLENTILRHMTSKSDMVVNTKVDWRRCTEIFVVKLFQLESMWFYFDYFIVFCWWFSGLFVIYTYIYYSYNILCLTKCLYSIHINTHHSFKLYCTTIGLQLHLSIYQNYNLHSHNFSIVIYFPPTIYLNTNSMTFCGILYSKKLTHSLWFVKFDTSKLE